MILLLGPVVFEVQFKVILCGFVVLLRMREPTVKVVMCTFVVPFVGLNFHSVSSEIPRVSGDAI